MQMIYGSHADSTIINKNLQLMFIHIFIHVYYDFQYAGTFFYRFDYMNPITITFDFYKIFIKAYRRETWTKYLFVTASHITRFVKNSSINIFYAFIICDIFNKIPVNRGLWHFQLLILKVRKQMTIKQMFLRWL